MKSISRFHNVILIKMISFTRYLMGSLIPFHLLVLLICFVWFILLTPNVHASSKNLLSCPYVIKEEKNLSPQPPTSSTPPISLAPPESTKSLEPLARRDEATRRSPQEPEIFKQLSEPLLRALKELARMQIAADEALATGNTTLYSEGNSLSLVTATQEDLFFRKAIGDSLKANNLEIKTRELKKQLTKQGFLLNDDQWRDLLHHQIYLIQNQKVPTSEVQHSAKEKKQHRQKWNETERAYQQQELSLIQLTAKLIHEVKNFDQRGKYCKHRNFHQLGKELFTAPEWTDHPHHLLALIDLGDQDVLQFIAEYILPKGH